MTEQAIYRFFRAWAVGVFASGGPFMVVTVPVGLSMLGDEEVWRALLVAIFPALVAAGPTLVGMILVGLPATVLLSEYQPERSGTYAKVGMAAGFAAPMILCLALYGTDGIFGSAFIGVFGGIAGLAAGMSWGNYREELCASRRDADAFADEEYHHPNPIHDLLF